MQKINWSILKRSISGNLTGEEERELDSWRKKSKDNERYYQKMRYFFSRERDEEVDVMKNFRRFKKRTYGKRRSFVINVMKYTAVFILFGGIISLWREIGSGSSEREGQRLVLAPGIEKAILYMGSGESIVLESAVKQSIIVADSFDLQKDSSFLNYTGIGRGGVIINEEHMMRVPRGGEFSMKLNDGTLVCLNAESDLRYPVQFNGKERRVFLSGEAYFNVTKSEKPFIVEVNGLEVKVLGTRFNVHAYKDEASFQTTLEQGSVEIGTKDKKLLLVPGEQAVLTNEGVLTKRTVDVNRYTAWKDGQFVFEDERLEDVMNTVARWYDVQVFYRDPSVKEVRINGNINRYKDFTVLLKKLEKLDIARFNIKGNSITVID